MKSIQEILNKKIQDLTLSELFAAMNSADIKLNFNISFGQKEKTNVDKAVDTLLPTPDLLTVIQFCKQYSISRGTLTKLIEESELLGCPFRVNVSDKRFNLSAKKYERFLEFKNRKTRK